MAFESGSHRRRSIRLRDYDYAHRGAYFVTICTFHRECLLGEVVHGEMQASDTGRMVQQIWRELPKHYGGVGVDAFQLMPNHIHGIIVLTGSASPQAVGAGPCACPGPAASGCAVRGVSLPDVVQRLKSLSAARYRQSVAPSSDREPASRLWQRNYFEHVMRNARDMNRIREYIVSNPMNWDHDRENPIATELGPELPWELAP